MRRPALLLVLLTLCVLVGGSVRGEAASSGTSVVGATVLSATMVDTTGCTGSDLAFGAFNVLTTTITPTTCDVTFGSTNDTSALRVFQADGDGSALTQLAPTPTKHSGAIDWEGLSAKSATEAWVVGVARKPGDPVPIARTTDGGATWTPQTSCTTSSLEDVDWVTGTTAVAVGLGSTICRTTDSGATWNTVTSPTPSTWYAVDIRSDGLGWLTGSSGKVASTTDGGATWSTLPVPDPTWTITEVEAASATRLYGSAMITSVSPRIILAVTSGDGGATWSSTVIGNTTGTGWGYSVVALSPTSAIVGSSYGKFRTTDSGATWSNVDPNTALCLTAQSPTDVLAFNGTGYPLRRSTDGGTTWTSISLPASITGQLWGCDSPDASTTFIAGYNDARARSTDAGVTWTAAPTAFQDLRGVAAWTTSSWVAVGSTGAIRRSTNGGTTITNPVSGTAQQLWDVVKTSSTSAVAVGSAGTILRTTDRGATWSTMTSGTATSLLDVDVDPAGRLWAVSSTAVLTSADGGVTWTPATPTGGAMSVIAAGPGGVLYVGTSGGAIYRSSNSGSSWTLQTSGTTLGITSIDTIDGVAVIAATTIDSFSDSHIVRTSNSGATWTVQVQSDTHSYGVAYLDAQTVYVGASSGYRRSADGGATWTATSGVTNAFAITPLDVNSAVIAGQGDVVATIKPTTGFSDYANGSVDFSGTTSTFGACLQTASGTASTLWPVAGVGNCTSGNLGNWRGIATDSSGGTAKVATTSTSGTGSLAFRFGLKAGSTQKPGAYSAQLVWEVVAPDS